ncbi:MAG TPA: glycoside hydrolase family 3 N-terminal domain-containing protein [Gemmatimonadaceae bacterium]|nr:glycoside hydrolase family 3 N-terminal domain-containing protein [Gemmatimonadaceae bacterium]
MRFRRSVVAGSALLTAGCAVRGTTPPGPQIQTTQPAPATLSPTTPLTAAQRHWVDSTLASLSLRDRVGQMVMVWMLGDYTNTRDSIYAEVIRWVEQDHIGGIAMSLGTPVEVAAKLNDLQRRSRVPLIVGADLEPGLGRLEGGVFASYMMDAGSATVFPSQMAIAATGRDSDAYDVAKATAEEGRAVGIQIDFAPVVDVNNNPANPVINTRSYGENAQRVARLSSLFVHGLRDGGQLATAKHFPGHGDTDVDSHVGLPIVTATMARLDTLELVPFKAAVKAGAALVMTAHIALPAVEGDSTTPATLAPKIITGLLRDSVGFRGTAITDAMTMEGIGKGYTTEQSSVLAVQAGADILLKPSDPTRAINAVVAAVERGEISPARIETAVRHILELKARSGVAFAPIVSLERLRDVVGAPEHRAIAADVARRAVTLLRDRDSLVPLAADTGRVLVVQYAPETELKAGRTFNAEIRRGIRNGTGRGTGVRIARVTPGATPDQLESLLTQAAASSTVIVTAYVRRVEGQGRFAIPQQIAAWIDSVAQHQRTIVVTFGNPYLIQQFPSVGSYMVTYGVSDDLERAAARAILGTQAITGRAPVSLPGFFHAGDGIQRAAAQR